MSIRLLPGDYCEEVIPDPIPNSEVKLFSADGTFNGTWYTPIYEKLTLKTQADFGFIGAYNLSLLFIMPMA